MQMEGRAWEMIRDKLIPGINESGKLLVIGLGVGEGLGEINLLNRILNEEEADINVQYLFVDRSPLLAYAHSLAVKEHFALQLASGRLTCAGVCGDYMDLDDAIRRARQLLEREGFGSGFYSNKTPAVVTLLGNNLGNQVFAEPDFTTSVKRTLSQRDPSEPHARPRPYALLLGVSEPREGEEYDENAGRFFLQTPFHLRKTRRLLVCSCPDEFELPDNELQLPESERRLSIRRDAYRSRSGITGSMFVFEYTLQGDVILYLEEDEDRVPTDTTLESGKRVTLYTVIKYQRDSLKRFLENLGFDVTAGESSPIPSADDPQRRMYSMIAATMNC